VWGYGWPNSAAKIAIFKQRCFILMILHGSYTYFCGPIYKDFFSTDQGKNFTKLRLAVTTMICCVSYFRDVTLPKFAQ